MICPTCNAWTRTLETRGKFDGTIHRRYECANMHKFSTTESVVFVPTTRAAEVRRLMHQDYPDGQTVSHLALCLGMHAYPARNILAKMRDAYIKSWVVENGKWVELWDIAESTRDAPSNCAKPTVKPPKVKQ